MQVTREHERRARQVHALLKASMVIRDGAWIEGAPSHVLPELLDALEGYGWTLQPIAERQRIKAFINGLFGYDGPFYHLMGVPPKEFSLGAARRAAAPFLQEARRRFGQSGW